MKRTWVVVLLVILSAIPAAASDILLYTPRANENLEIGVPALITWLWGDLSNVGNLKIVLMQNNKELGIIAENFSPPNNIMTYVWNVGNYFVRRQSGLTTPLHAGIGTGYSVKIQSMNNLYSGISGPFTLSAKLIPPPAPAPIEASSKFGERTFKALPSTISITSPKAGDRLWGVPGVVNEIYWKMSGKMNQNVSVALLCNGAFVATLAASTPNNGTFSWNTNTTPISPHVWGPCTLRVRTLDGGVEAVSREFIVAHLQ